MDPIYIFPLPKIFSPGYMVRIRGSAPQNGSRFNVNFQLGAEYTKFDIACHLSVRYGEGRILELNSYDVKKRWIRPETYSNLPFNQGMNFDILVLCELNQLRVAINGQHFCDFRHRIPFSKITHVDIRGQVAATSISFEDNMQQVKDMIGGSYPFPPIVRM